MLRYLQLYASFVRFSLSRALEFRLDFWFRIVMDLIYYAINIAFFKIIYNHTGILGGWDEQQVMVFVGAYLVVDALFMTIFSNNVWWLPQLVNKGDLDYYIVRPVSSLFFVSLREFAINSFVNLVMAVAILVWAIAQLPQPFGIGQYLFFTLLLFNGVLIYFLVNLCFVLPVFWLHSARGLGMTFYALCRFMERPHRIFSGMTRVVLMSIMPMSMMASIPTKLFIEGFHLQLYLQLLTVTAVFFGIVVMLWHWGLRSYSSASS